MAKTILILAANPKGTARLRLDQEVREIDSGLQRAQRRDEYILRQVWAVRLRDFRRAMLDFKPNIVHFCGHGSRENGIIFENEDGTAEFVGSEALSDFFKLFVDTVECVILNACYSELQARAIARHVPYVIGISQTVEDNAAIEFVIAFYDALGAGRSIEFAYNLACNAVKLAGLPKISTPVLIKRECSVSESSGPHVPTSSVEEFIKNMSFQRISYQGKAKLVKGSGHEIYLVLGNTRHWIPDGLTVARLRKKFGNVRVMDDVEIELYPRGRDLPSLCPRIVEILQGDRFLLADGTRRRILGRETLIFLGGHPETVPVVSIEEITPYKEGESIPEQIGLEALRSPPRLVKSIYPEIYLVRGKIKRWVPNHSVLKRLAAQFRIPGVQRVEVGEVEDLIEGLPVGEPFVPLI